MRALVLILCLSSTASAQQPSPAPEWHPFLWRIELKRPSYLLGTMHLPDARSEHWPELLSRVAGETDAVFVEISLDFRTLLALSARMSLPRDGTLEQILPPPIAQRLERFVRASDGLYWFAEHRKKVWAVTMDLEVGVGSPTAALDIVLSRFAEAHHKQLGSLETLEEQLDVTEGLSLADQIQILSETLDELEKDPKKHEQERLREAFFSGDERAMLKLLDEPIESAAAKRMTERLITLRNPRLTSRIQARLRPDSTQLFAVGVAHMLGKDGIVARLRKAGIRVVRLR